MAPAAMAVRGIAHFDAELPPLPSALSPNRPAGPWLEAKEHAGVSLLEAADLDEVLEWTAKAPLSVGRRRIPQKPLGDSGDAVCFQQKSVCRKLEGSGNRNFVRRVNGSEVHPLPGKCL